MAFATVPRIVRASRSALIGAQRWSSGFGPREVNNFFAPGVPTFQVPDGATDEEKHFARDVATCDDARVAEILEEHRHLDWTSKDLEEVHAKHGLMTWNAHSVGNAAAIKAVRGEGCYFWDANGHKYLDFNSMAMCSNFGHTIDPSITKAVVDQLETLPYAYPGLFLTEPRVKLTKLLADICPGDLNTFMFPSAGAEANEGAMRIAQRYTGRQKILSRHRGYHGHTLGSLAATGDFRRWAAGGGISDNFVKFFGPYPYTFRHGETEALACERSLVMLEEQLKYEGPHNVAAIILEAVPGANGILPPPPGYIQGIRKLTEKHGILMICDEVMSGFGRTGKLFSFSHYDVVPDIVTFAKGVNGAYLPMAGIGIRDHVAQHFHKNNIMIGSTYHSHPVAVASAYAALKVSLRDGLTQNAARLEPIMKECLNDLLAKHPSVKQARCIGLFAGFDVQKNRRGDFIAEVHEPVPAAMTAFKQDLFKRGLFTFTRPHNVFINPPLIISEEQLREGFSIISESLKILDDAMED